MYDMYYWDHPDRAALNGTEQPGRPANGTAHPRRAGSGAGPAAQAVQVALDRRDNGGVSSAPRDQ